MANGGSNFNVATSFGTIRLPGSRGVSGAFNGNESQEWFKISVLGKNLRFGSFSYSTSAGILDKDTDVIPTVNLFFQPKSRGALRKVDSFPGVSNDATSFFPIQGTGTFYVQVLGSANNYYNNFSLNFSARKREFDFFS